MGQRSGLGVALIIASLLLAACSSGSDDADADTASPPDSAAVAPTSELPAESADAVGDETASVQTDDAAADETASDAAELDAGSSFVAGDIEYRAVNLTDEPVDLYVRTSGFIEAFLVEEGFAPGAVSDFVAPPADQGRFLVTTAGAGDATCVIDCDHIVGELIAFPDEGPVRTVLIHPDDGGPAVFEFWEQPTDEALDSGNAMIDADPAKTLAAFSAVAIVEPDFGYRVTTDVADGCLADVNDSDLLIGGNQIIPYDFVNATEFTLHDFEDEDCSEAPVGGPFSFSGTQGARYHVMLHGTPGALEALVLAMVDGATDNAAPAAAPADASESAGDGSAERDEVIDLMAAEVTAAFELVEPDASCVATLLVERIGADRLVVDGALVDLGSFPGDVNQLAGEALVASVAECGIDPSVFR